jgi:Glycosyltransferase family 87
VLLVSAILIAMLRLNCLGCSIGGLRLGFGARAMNDFQTTVYYPVKAFAEGVNPYDSAEYLARYPAPQLLRLYPPAMLILFRPFAALSLETAARLQAALTIILSGLLAVVSLRLAAIRSRPAAVLLVWALILFSRPGQWNLLLGQITLLVVLGTYGALAASRRSALLAGLGLALSLLKPNFGLPLAALMLARGQVSGVAVGATIAGILNVFPLPRLAELSGGMMKFITLFISGAQQYAQSSGPRGELTVYRVDAGGLLGQWLPTPLGWLGSLLVAGVVLGLVVWALRRRGRPSASAEVLDPAAAGLLCCAILLSLYHIGYDMLLLAWPFVGIVSRLRRSPGRASSRHLLQIGLLTLLAVNYASSYSVIDAVHAHGALLGLLTSLNGTALVALFGLFLLDVATPVVVPDRDNPSMSHVPAPSRRMQFTSVDSKAERHVR